MWFFLDEIECNVKNQKLKHAFVLVHMSEASTNLVEIYDYA